MNKKIQDLDLTLNQKIKNTEVKNLTQNEAFNVKNNKIKELFKNKREFYIKNLLFYMKFN